MFFKKLQIKNALSLSIMYCDLNRDAKIGLRLVKIHLLFDERCSFVDKEVYLSKYVGKKNLFVEKIFNDTH